VSLVWSTVIEAKGSWLRQSSLSYSSMMQYNYVLSMMNIVPVDCHVQKGSSHDVEPPADEAFQEYGGWSNSERFIQIAPAPWLWLVGITSLSNDPDAPR